MASWKISTKDPLSFVRLTTFIDLLPTYSTYMRILCTFIFSLIVLAHMFGIYMQYFNENYQDMHAVNSLGIYLAATHLIYYSQIMTQVKSSLVLLEDSFKSFKSEGPKTHEHVFRKFQWVKWLHMTSFILISVATYYVIFTDALNDVSTFNAIVAISGRWRPLMSLLLAIINLVAIFLTASLAILQIYMCFYIGTQFVLIQYFIRRKLHDVCDINDVSRQDEIYQSLKEFVNMYKTTQGVACHYTDRMSVILLIEFFPSAAGFVSLIYSLVHVNFSYVCLIFPIVWLLITFSCAFVGQIVIDESSKTFDLMCDCPWYGWNSKNRKALLIILPIIKKPITLSFMKLIHADYSFILKFYRVVHAIVTFLSNTRS